LPANLYNAPANIDSYMDHRMAMTFSLDAIGFAAPVQRP
jgi:5-enolpyruvylshikimate-3-phosphate synthase